jgi:hypothetical protein
MSQYLRLYLKLFVATAVPMVLIIGLMLILSGFPSWQGALFFTSLVGLFCGGCMSLVFGTMHILGVRKVVGEHAENQLGVRQVRIVKLPLAYSDGFESCIASLKLINKCRIQNRDRLQGVIEARTGMTWKSLGCAIILAIHKLDDGNTQVTISSRPVWPMTLVDYGSGLENVESIAKFPGSQVSEQLSGSGRGEAVVA